MALPIQLRITRYQSTLNLQPEKQVINMVLWYLLKKGERGVRKCAAHTYEPPIFPRIIEKIRSMRKMDIGLSPEFKDWFYTYPVLNNTRKVALGKKSPNQAHRS